MTENSIASQPIGYGKPPVTSRFAKGRSGNPIGRSKGKFKGAPYEAVLGRKIQILENGVEKTATAADAFLLHLAKQGLSGRVPEAIAALDAINHGKVQRVDGVNYPASITLQFVTPGNPNSALFHFGMARKPDVYRETNRTVIEPWLVQAALERLGDKRFTIAEQDTIMQATRSPNQVKWPDWWVMNP